MTCVPGYLERFNIIINLNDIRSSKAFLLHLLERLRFMLVRTLPFTVNRIIFIGSTEEIKDKYQDFKKKMRPFCEVKNIEDGDTDALLEIIEPDQLEHKFGGDRPDMIDYWPPIHHTAPNQSIDEEDFGKLRLIPFFIYDEDFEKFKHEHIPTGIQIQGRMNAQQIKFKKRSFSFTKLTERMLHTFLLLNRTQMRKRRHLIIM